MRQVTAAFLSRFALPLLIATLIAFAATGSLLSRSPVVIGVQAIAVGLSIWARRSFPSGAFRVTAEPAAAGIIRRGPYRVIRHPMYAAALLIVWAAALSHPAAWRVILAALVTGIVVARIVQEERLLRERYPEYGEYMRSTRALVPFVV